MEEKVPSITETKMGPQATEGHCFFINHQRPKITKGSISLGKLSKDPEKHYSEPSATVSGVSEHSGHKLDNHRQSD